MKSLKLFLITFILFFLQSVLLQLLTGSTSLESVWVTFLSCIAVLCVMIFVVFSKEKFRYYGICRNKETIFKRQMYVFLLMPLVNAPYFFNMVKINLIEVIIQMVFVGIMEEIIFRGFLYRAIEEKSNTKIAILLSSFIFGLYHLVNIGSAPIQYVLLQVIYAVASGIIFAVFFSKTESIIPCMIVHALVDIIGSFSEIPNPVVETVGTFIILVCAVYYLYLMKADRDTA